MSEGALKYRQDLAVELMGVMLRALLPVFNESLTGALVEFEIDLVIVVSSP